MKTRARLLSVVLAAVMVIGSAIPAFAAPAADEYHVELDQVGSFTKEGIRVYSGTFVEGVSDDEAYAYDMNGKKIFTDTIKGVEKLEKGVYDAEKAIIAFFHVTTEASNQYKKDFGYSFTVTERWTAAQDMRDAFIAEYNVNGGAAL